MNAKKAKAIHRQLRKIGRDHTADNYFIGENGMILSDRNRRTYKMMKKRGF